MGARTEIAAEFRNHVWEVVRCPHANHVVQKCIMTMRPHALQFVIDEIATRVCKIAKHQYGCRILQRLLEHCRPDQMVGLVEDLLSEAVPLCKHIYGHFVMQHILEHSTEFQRQRLIKVLEQHVDMLGSDKHGAVLVGTALAYGRCEDQLTLLNAILKQNGLIVSMAQTRHGHVAVKLALSILQGDSLSQARLQLASDVELLRSIRYGRSVLKVLGECSNE